MRLRKIHDVEKCHMLSHMMMWTICVHSVALNFVLFKICVDPECITALVKVGSIEENVSNYGSKVQL